MVCCNKYMQKIAALICLIFICCTAVAQPVSVLDSTDHKPVPFATVRFGNTGNGTIASLEGIFKLDNTTGGAYHWIEISCLGYNTQKITLPIKGNVIFLSRNANILTEVVVKPPYDKIRRILNKAIAGKDANNPEKYDWYRCKVYYKMTIDLSIPDSALKNDTSADAGEMRDFLEHQHLLMSETYSTRTWKRPQQLQEVVTGSRFSGLRKSLFTGLVTDVLPFHAYTDYINLNGKDYHNPVSKGYEQYYKFDLVDELVQEGDTTWILSYKPRGINANQLKGRVYINSDGFAISHFIGGVLDTSLKRDVRIEQEYQRVANGEGRKWFPAHLNYIIDWEQKGKENSYTWFIKGNSRIDSVSFTEDADFRFDKAHTVKLVDKADELTDSAWRRLRPESLDKKEARTYVMMDSFGEVKHFDRYVSYIEHLPEGKLSIGKIDVDLKRLFSSNKYENIRAGLGLQTNDRLLKWLSIGAWGGYGFGDAHWKYGAFAELYADKVHEFTFKAGYADDINDPGRVHLHADLDKNYLNSYLLYRVDNIKMWHAAIKKKLGYWSLELAGRQQQIQPKYLYAFEYRGRDYTQFKAAELSLGFRYAFAERTAPFFNSYYTLGSKYPIWYGRVTAGQLQAGEVAIPYVQALTALTWQKHINRVGNERAMISAGRIWSDDALPLGKLFAGAGYRYDPHSSLDVSIYTFGGFLTMNPYGYYTDQFVSAMLRHDFDRRLYKVTIPGTKVISSPFVGGQYNFLYGTLRQPQAQKQVQFTVPDHGYHEAGALLNNILMIKYLNIYYFTINAGYFYHFGVARQAGNEGKFVAGVNVEF